VGLAVALAGLAPAGLAAQDAGMTRAFELERQGNYAAAAEAYRAVLAARPAHAAALLGLERVLLPLDQPADILPQVRAAMASGRPSAPVYGVALRAWAAADEPDSMRATAERWAAAVPGDEAPFREWGAAALARRDRAGAVAAYRRGRAALHRPDALAAELAQVAVADGDYGGALREWLAAVRRLPGYRGMAVSTLGQAPDSLRGGLLAELERDRDLTAARLAADLRTRWGDPLGGLGVLERALPEEGAAAIEALHGFLDPLRTASGREARAAQGRALELIAERSPAPQQARVRLEAARAYTAAGDRDAARRMLVGIAEDRGAPSAVSAGAAATLVQVLIGEGKLDEAAHRLAGTRAVMPAEEYATLRRRLVLGYIHAGNLTRADSALGADSTVDGLALAGRILLYRGDLAGAVKRFEAAGPFAGDRDEATERTSLLALLQPIATDTLPELGAALLQLARGDTAKAIEGLDRVAAGLPPAHGAAEVRLLAGRLAAATAKTADAERLLRAAAVPGAPGTAPAAELALAELLLAQKRPADAVAQLEHLILTYPGSALVPQARRRLDEARGAVPRT
jgi:tetratricopeptide (TPR) repeat protein